MKSCDCLGQSLASGTVVTAPTQVSIQPELALLSCGTPLRRTHSISTSQRMAIPRRRMGFKQVLTLPNLAQTALLMHKIQLKQILIAPKQVSKLSDLWHLDETGTGTAIGHGTDPTYQANAVSDWGCVNSVLPQLGFLAWWGNVDTDNCIKQAGVKSEPVTNGTLYSPNSPSVTWQWSQDSHLYQYSA